MVRRTSLLLLLTLLPASVFADKEHADIAGEVDDEHGNVGWKSSVQQAKELWEYYYEAENRDDRRNCRVNWVLPMQNWLIPPLETSKSRTQVTGKPIEKEGEFRYNGGAAAGEGVTKTAAWMDHDPKATSSKTSATVFIELDGQTFAVDLHASSELDKDSVVYKLSLKPAERTVARYERDLDKMFPKCRVQWVSIQSPAWTREGMVTYKAGKYGDAAIVQLDKTSLTFEAYVPIGGLGDPVVARDVVRFFVGEVDDKNVLCEVAVPAIVPKGG